MEPLTGPQKGADGGEMDDILASIRRILHSEQAGDSDALSETAPPPQDIIDLHPAMLIDAPVPAAYLDTAPAVVAAPVFASPENGTADFTTGSGTTGAEALLGDAAAARSAASFGALRDVLAERDTPEATLPTTVYRSGGLTIEDVVRGEVRLLLKTWLDENLQPMVEHMVRAEIARISARS